MSRRAVDKGVKKCANCDEDIHWSATRCVECGYLQPKLTSSQNTEAEEANSRTSASSRTSGKQVSSSTSPRSDSPRSSAKQVATSPRRSESTARKSDVPSSPRKSDVPASPRKSEATSPRKSGAPSKSAPSKGVSQDLDDEDDDDKPRDDERRKEEFRQQQERKRLEVIERKRKEIAERKRIEEELRREEEQLMLEEERILMEEEEAKKSEQEKRRLEIVEKAKKEAREQEEQERRRKEIVEKAKREVREEERRKRQEQERLEKERKWQEAAERARHEEELARERYDVMITEQDSFLYSEEIAPESEDFQSTNDSSYDSVPAAKPKKPEVPSYQQRGATKPTVPVVPAVPKRTHNINKSSEALPNISRNQDSFARTSSRGNVQVETKSRSSTVKDMVTKIISPRDATAQNNNKNPPEDCMEVLKNPYWRTQLQSYATNRNERYGYIVMFWVIVDEFKNSPWVSAAIATQIQKNYVNDDAPFLSGFPASQVHRHSLIDQFEELGASQIPSTFYDKAHSEAFWIIINELFPVWLKQVKPSSSPRTFRRNKSGQDDELLRPPQTTQQGYSNIGAPVLVQGNVAK